MWPQEEEQSVADYRQRRIESDSLRIKKSRGVETPAKRPQVQLGEGKEPTKIPRFVTDEHFIAIYNACDIAERPAGLPYPAADWRRGLLTFIYFTG